MLESWGWMPCSLKAFVTNSYMTVLLMGIVIPSPWVEGAHLEDKDEDCGNVTAPQCHTDGNNGPLAPDLWVGEVAVRAFWALNHFCLFLAMLSDGEWM